MANKVIVSGHLCLDIIPSFHETTVVTGTGNFFEQGSLIPVGPVKISTGGAVSNVGITLTRLGIDTVLNGKTGDDAFGDIIRNILTQYAEIGSVRTATGETSSYTIVLSPPGVDRILFHNAGVNDTFTAQDVDYEACKDATLFHFGYPPLMRGLYADGGENLSFMFSKIKANGLITSLDMAFPGTTGEASEIDWRKLLKRVLPFVDLFCPSFEEAMFMLQPVEYWRMLNAGMYEDFVDQADGPLLERIANSLLDMGTSMVLLKCGRKGLYLRTGELNLAGQRDNVCLIEKSLWSNLQLWIPAFSCQQMINAAGAGDCAIAGFIAAFIRGIPPENTLRTAALLGYQNLLAPSAFGGICNWKDTQSMAECEMLSIKIDPGGTGWLWDNKYCLWRKSD